MTAVKSGSADQVAAGSTSSTARASATQPASPIAASAGWAARVIARQSSTAPAANSTATAITASIIHRTAAAHWSRARARSLSSTFAVSSGRSCGPAISKRDGSGLVRAFPLAASRATVAQRVFKR